MTDPMTPADVPQQLVDAATFAFAARSVATNDSTDFVAYVRAQLAAVLPLHAQQVRARAAADLRAVAFHCPTHDIGEMPTFDPRCVACQRYAALVGAERIVAGRESPSAKAVREMRQAQAEAVVTLDDLKDD